MSKKTKKELMAEAKEEAEEKKNGHKGDSSEDKKEGEKDDASGKPVRKHGVKYYRAKRGIR